MAAMWLTVVNQTKWAGVMANPEHLEILKRGVEAWNEWRTREPSIVPSLEGADLRKMKLGHMFRDHHGINLRKARLRGANLSNVWAREADFAQADLTNANLCEANLSKANLGHATLFGASCYRAVLSDANLSFANLANVDFSKAALNRANLTNAMLFEANFSQACLERADLSGADLRRSLFVETNIMEARLYGCTVYGMSAWHVIIDGLTVQQNLFITDFDEPAIMVDGIEIAQFVYLLLQNEKIRGVIDTVTSKVVLILGRFTPERKEVLDAIREELRNRHYVPILFDFDVPATRDITETVSLLARMARFIIADLTDPSSIPKELEAIIPQLAVPVQPLLEGERPYAMFKDYWKYDWVLPVHRYESLTSLLGTLAEKVIEPAESKMNELADKRRRFEAELMQPR
jgi:Pentapeptide repeats (8 copies)